MRSAFEERHGTLTDDQVPGKTYMEKRLEQIEKSDFKAESLADVLSLDEDEGSRFVQRSVQVDRSRRCASGRESLYRAPPRS